MQAALDTKLNIKDVGSAFGVPSFATDEAVVGTIDGVNAVFTILNVPNANSLVLYTAGLRLLAGTAYAISGSVITMQPGYIPASEAERPRADYRYAGAPTAPGAGSGAGSGTGSGSGSTLTTVLSTTITTQVGVGAFNPITAQNAALGQASGIPVQFGLLGGLPQGFAVRNVGPATLLSGSLWQVEVDIYTSRTADEFTAMFNFSVDHPVLTPGQEQYLISFTSLTPVQVTLP